MQESSWRALELFQELQQGGLHGVGHRTRGSITVRSWPLHVRAYQPTYRDSTLVSRICQLWFATTSNPHLIHEYWGEYLYSDLNVQKYIYMYKHEESWFLDGEQNYLVGFYSLSISIWTIPTERGECVNNLNSNQVVIFWALTLQSKIWLDGGRLTLNH